MQTKNRQAFELLLNSFPPKLKLKIINILVEFNEKFSSPERTDSISQITIGTKKIDQFTIHIDGKQIEDAFRASGSTDFQELADKLGMFFDNANKGTIKNSHLQSVQQKKLQIYQQETELDLNTKIKRKKMI